jgi:hypothetical protein
MGCAMKNNNILFNAVAISILGLMCFGALGDVAYASEGCPAMPITVVNQSIYSVTVQGKGDPIVIGPKSTIATTVQSKYFYSHCGLIHLGLNSNTVKSGLIDTKAASVQISIRPDDKVDQIGMTAQGFDLDNYLSWHGYKSIL